MIPPDELREMARRGLTHLLSLRDGNPKPDAVGTAWSEWAGVQHCVTPRTRRKRTAAQRKAMSVAQKAAWAKRKRG